MNRQLKITLFLISGILLFSLSFPGYFTSDGLPYFSFIALYPVYLAILNMNKKETVFYGFIYGTTNYLLFNYWLKGFSPVAFSVVPIIQGFYNILLFIILRFIIDNAKKAPYIPLTLCWLLYEVFRGENIIGYNYGTLAHAFYKTNHFSGLVDITGTYVLSLLIIFPSIYLAYTTYYKLKVSVKYFIPIFVYLTILTAAVLYTHKSKVNYNDAPTVRTSLIQHNLDCWLKGSTDLYKMALDDLLELSKKAEMKNPDIVIWSESAFVPAIEWHKEYQTNKGRYELVKTMEEFFKTSKANYLVGSNETIGAPGDSKKRYNPVYQYKNGSILSKYRKVRLVPFMESFPYPKLLPWLYKYTLSLGANQLLPGKEIKNFNFDSFKATPLICYEDTFSEHSRKSVLNGSDLLINLTNDAWSKEEAASKQHLSAAVFRSLENRRSMVRSGTSGYTCIIDPNGIILAELPLLTKGELTFDTPLYSEKVTFYTKHGNIIERILLIVFFIQMFVITLKSTPVKELLKKILKKD